MDYVRGGGGGGGNWCKCDLSRCVGRKFFKCQPVCCISHAGKLRALLSVCVRSALTRATQRQKCANLTNPVSEVCWPDQPSVRSVLTWPIQHQVCQPDQSSIRSVQTRPTQSEMCTCQQSPDASLFPRSAIESFSVDLIDDVCTTSVHNPPWSLAFQARHTHTHWFLFNLVWIFTTDLIYTMLHRHTHFGSIFFLVENLYIIMGHCIQPLQYLKQRHTQSHFSPLKLYTILETASHSITPFSP